MSGRRMTPLQLARFIPEDPDDPLMEDPHAMPSGGMSALDQPGMMSQGMADMSPGFNMGAGESDLGPQTSTAVNACMATSCANNCNGMCSLDSVEINDRGGCDQYEAGAEDNAALSDGRYDEQDADVSGGAPDTSQRFDHGRWDPTGGGY